MTWTETWNSWSPCGGDMLCQRDRAESGIMYTLEGLATVLARVRVFPKVAKTQTECKEGSDCGGEEISTMMSLKQSPCARPWAETLPQGHSQVQGEDKNNLSSWWQCGQCSNRGIAVTFITADIWTIARPSSHFFWENHPSSHSWFCSSGQANPTPVSEMARGLGLANQNALCL